MVHLQGELLIAGGSVEGPVRRVASGLHDLSELSVWDRSHVVVTPRVDPLWVSAGSSPWKALIVEERPSDPAGSLHLPGPIVRLDADLFREGEMVRVDGATGEVDLLGVEEVRVVTSFLEASDRTVLLLRRSSQVGTFQGRWAGVSGFLEEPSAEAQARKEIREETGIGADELELRAEGRVVYARDANRVFTVYPFRFRSRTKDVHLDWEHSEAEWAPPQEIYRRQTVPKLQQVWESVAPEPAENLQSTAQTRFEAKR